MTQKRTRTLSHSETQLLPEPLTGPNKERPTTGHTHTQGHRVHTPHAYGQRVRPEIQYILSRLDWPSDVQPPAYCRHTHTRALRCPCPPRARLHNCRSCSPAPHLRPEAHRAGVGLLSPKDSRLPPECRHRSGGDTPCHRALHHRTPSITWAPPRRRASCAPG